MTTRLFAPAAAALLLAAPAAAQPANPVTTAMVATFDACLDRLKNNTDFAAAVRAQGYTQAGGGWARTVGATTLAVSLNEAAGTPTRRIRVCAVTVRPSSSDIPGLQAALAQRARVIGLPATPPREIGTGSVITSYQNLSAKGVASLTIVSSPAQGDLAASTSLAAVAQ